MLIQQCKVCLLTPGSLGIHWSAVHYQDFDQTPPGKGRCGPTVHPISLKWRRLCAQKTCCCSLCGLLTWTATFPIKLMETFFPLSHRHSIRFTLIAIKSEKHGLKNHIVIVTTDIVTGMTHNLEWWVLDIIFNFTEIKMMLWFWLAPIANKHGFGYCTWLYCHFNNVLINCSALVVICTNKTWLVHWATCWLSKQTLWRGGPLY